MPPQIDGTHAAIAFKDSDSGTNERRHLVKETTSTMANGIGDNDEDDDDDLTEHSNAMN